MYGWMFDRPKITVLQSCAIKWCVCSEIDYCMAHQCQNGGQCINLELSYNCICFNDTYGRFCQWRTYISMLPVIKL